jgi:hypothetical protein
MDICPDERIASATEWIEPMNLDLPGQDIQGDSTSLRQSGQAGMAMASGKGLRL